MNKTWVVFKNEIITIVSRRSFILTLILVPLVPFIILQILGAIGTDKTAAVGQFLSGNTPVQKVDGYIDQSGIIKQLPSKVDQTMLKAYPSVDSAHADLAAGKLSGYYILPPDYLTTGKITYVSADFNPLGGFNQSGTFQYVVRYNLLGDDLKLTERLNNPLNVEYVGLSTEASPQRDPNSMLTFFLPYGVTMILYILILGSASQMLNSITTEKQNRVMEILLSSVRPVQMLIGKIIALGLAGLLQTVFWSSCGLLMLRMSGRTLNLPAGFQLPASILIWTGIFFILGYALYASLMAGVGAMVPSLKEASSATMVMIIPMIIPLMFLTALIETPHGPVAMFLSLFPFTAPVAMMTRLSAANIPIWQPILAAAILAATAGLVIRAIAGMFRAQYLLIGQSFTFGLFVKSLFGKGV